MLHLSKLYIPVIANIDGDTVEDYHKIAWRLSSLEGLAALEVNISCPNVEKWIRCQALTYSLI